jgi:DNA polymerase-3 subunit alpha
VERHNTEKIGLLIGECRAMDIAVLPPDINKSDIYFKIEDNDDGPVIRFGLGAIKNVGEGAVEVILQDRGENGPYSDVDEFCRRVDLRQVNRRALESLIKVGALRPFGERSQLLAIIDRMMGLSSQTHQAAAVGQISMFDLGGFDAPVGGSILYPLPEVEEVSRREILGWEKELVGVYVSEHPMQRLMQKIGGAVTCLLGQIDETMAGHMVTVAGMINWVRQIYTKTGKPMAFVELEDMHGTIELVVFPRIYEETQVIWRQEQVVVVRGKVDMKDGTTPKIICEKVDDAVTHVGPELKTRELPSSYTAHAGNRGSLSDPQPAYHLQITVNRTGDSIRDRRRLRSVYELVTSYTGQDSFSLFVPNGERRLELDFPNATTRHCVELQQKLAEMLGAAAIRVETRNDNG